jgi:hypothetical protein
VVFQSAVKRYVCSAAGADVVNRQVKIARVIDLESGERIIGAVSKSVHTLCAALSILYLYGDGLVF